MVGVETPVEADPKGDFFKFEKSLHKDTDGAVAGSSLTPFELLRALFEEPKLLRPGKSQTKLTEEVADKLKELVDDLKEWNRGSKEPISDQEIARFIMRMVFCFFASDVGLLAKEAFTDLITHNKTKPKEFRKHLGELFSAMKDGGEFLCAKSHTSTADCSIMPASRI
jgi:hypothetical protein